MAQQSRKRRSKHRGNAAGIVEARGRTSRPPSADERKKATRAAARERRLSKPPTWNSAIKKGALATAFVFVALMLMSKGSVSHRIPAALIGAALAFAIYSLFGYYMEMFMYRRHMAKQAAGRR